MAPSTTMFPFDQSSLPQLTARRAFIGVDFQQDFLSDDGALPIKEPSGFVDRAIQLAAALRSAGGDVVWVQSRFDGARPVDDDSIIVGDEPPMPLAMPGRRGRRNLPAAVSRALQAADAATAAVDTTAPPDPEAFLSHDEPRCLASDSAGSELASAIRDTTHKTDILLTKSHYSAFNETQLLRVLRAKMVMEVYICGSLANVGVHATAMDAAGHGLSITVVEDCCGYRSDARQAKAVQHLMESTGCEVASCQEVLDAILPAPSSNRSALTKSNDEPPAAAKDADDKSSKGARGARVTTSPGLSRPMTALTLDSDSPKPKSADTPKAAIKACTRVPSRSDSLSKEGELSPIEPADAQDAQSIKKDALDESKGLDELSPPSPTSSNQSPTTSTTGEGGIGKVMDEASITNGASNDLSRDGNQEDAVAKQLNLCEGDTDVVEDLLPPELEEGIFDKLRNEIKWQRMSHQGGEVPRLVAVQGEVASDGSMPVYRHPSDEAPPLLPFSSTVRAIKGVTEKQLGHPLNHALIQFYRDGNDYISEHSDKTLDIVRGSYIANVSLGAERTMVLRTKRLAKDPSLAPPDAAIITFAATAESPDAPKPRTSQRARLPHNSLCRMGPQTNMKWLHSIRQDKRAEREKSESELAFAGGRISLTFRHIGTFLNKEETLIWGQGAESKSREDAHAVINGQSPQAIKMLQAFGTENRSSIFDWDDHYGKGFDVLHISNSPRFFASADPLINMRIALMLGECGITYAKGSMAPAISTKTTDDLDPDSLPVKFVDNDPGRSIAQGHVAIMMYLDAVYDSHRQGEESKQHQAGLAKRYSRYQQSLAFFRRWRQLQLEADGNLDIKHLARDLAEWESFASESEAGYLAGNYASLPDYVIWPILHTIMSEHGDSVFDGRSSLRKFYETFKASESSKKIIGVDPQG